MADYPIVRDTLTNNDFVINHYRNYSGSGACVLLARSFTLASEFRIDKGDLLIVCDVFDGNGHAINASGIHSTHSSTPGAHGKWPGYLPGSDGIPAGPGGDGEPGTAGGNGTHARSVTLFCREARNVKILAFGGNGTNGAPGGNGSTGVNGFQRDGWQDPDHIDPDTGQVTVGQYHPPIDIPGTNGGNGGWGGRGGNGGNAGHIKFACITEVGEPVFDVTAGSNGWGGGGGYRGEAGQGGDPEGSIDGNPGDPGTPGNPGSLTIAVAADDSEFGQLIRPLIGDDFANHWAPFRIAMGDYHYHKYNPPLYSDGTHASAQDLRDADRELARGLELQPDNNLALTLKDRLTGRAYRTPNGEEVWWGGGINALGLPRELDLLPDFQLYKTAYDGAVPQLLQFLQMAIYQLTAAQTPQQLAQLVQVMLAEATVTRDNLALDVPVAEQEKALADEDVRHLDSQLQQIRIEIEAGLAKMEDDDFDFLGIAGTLAQVGAAVVGVIAAVPSFGASLVALVPALVSLSNTVLDDADEVVKALFKGDAVDDKAIKEAYDKVDKKADAVIKSGKTIVNFVKVIKEIGARATTDNSERVALVKRGVEVTHQLLMARNRLTLADIRLEASRGKVANADRAIEQAGIALGSYANTTKMMMETGLLALRLVSARSDAANRIAFRAQRSAEIYTLKDQSHKVHLDAGAISPEIWRKYHDREIAEPQLVQELLSAWSKMLAPISLHEDYLAYFDAPRGTDWLRLSFRGPLEIQEMRKQRRFSFHIDPAELPDSHREAKVRAVRLALVGAKHPNNEISCEIQRDGIYEHRLADGSTIRQALAPRLDRRNAKLGQLSPEEGLADDPPLTAPNSLSFWGRGVGGSWIISIPEDQLANGLLDLTGLEWIQVWIAYQHLQRPS